MCNYLISDPKAFNRTITVSGQVRHMGTMRNLVERVSVERFKERYRKLSLIDGFWAGDPSRLRAELQGRGNPP